jgi:hypothetical protein
MTMRWPICCWLSNRVSLVKYGTLSSPGMGGTAGDEPVAMTKRRAVIFASPATTVLASMNLAPAWMTRTPSPVKRSMESLGSMAAITLLMWSCTPFGSTAGETGRMPKGADERMMCARRAAAIMAFEGTQP